MTNPMTTGGDIIYGGASGVPTRLANGTAGQVLQSNGATLAPTWVAAGSGTVTTVSVVTANGFAGTVATDTTTPAITLTTSITGVLKGNGTAISAATAGSDYAVGSIGLAGGQTIAGGTLTNENLTLRANAADLTTGQINVTSSKEATNTTTASVALDGGLAVAKRVYALDMTVTNTITGSVSGNAGTASAVAVGGITGLGTNVATALAVNVGSAGAFVVLDGALGTPSSGTVTNLTGTASININGTVGATTPTTGVFTTLVAGSTTSLLLGTAGSAMGNIGFRNATSGTITLAPVTGALGTVTLTLPAATDTVAVLAATQTFTNKRITPRVLSATSYTTDTGTSINGDTQDMFIVTAQAGALKFNNPTGTPTDGQKLILTVASSAASARALTWDTLYGATTVALPTTTAATTATLSIGFIYSSSKTLWQCVAVA